MDISKRRQGMSCSTIAGRHMVLLVQLPAGACPQSPLWAPPSFEGGDRYINRVPLYAAIGFSLVFNKKQLAAGIPDRKWAVPATCKPSGSLPLDAMAIEDAQRIGYEVAQVEKGVAL